MNLAIYLNTCQTNIEFRTFILHIWLKFTLDRSTIHVYPQIWPRVWTHDLWIMTEHFMPLRSFRPQGHQWHLFLPCMLDAFVWNSYHRICLKIQELTCRTWYGCSWCIGTYAPSWTLRTWARCWICVVCSRGACCWCRGSVQTQVTSRACCTVCGLTKRVGTGITIDCGSVIWTFLSSGTLSTGCWASSRIEVRRAGNFSSC